MEYQWEILATTLVLMVSGTLYFLIKRKSCENKEAQKMLNDYLGSDLSPLEIGMFYERYIGHIYEQEGYHVKYYGAINGVNDLGRDLIVKNDDSTFVIQTKCWAKNKSIKEKHIFQLYGTLEHYKKTHPCHGKEVQGIFYSTTRYSKTAIEVAEVLGIELCNRDLEKNYPLIKCNVNKSGDRLYHLPFDPYYDKIRIDSSKEKAYVYTVDEAVARGFTRAKAKKNKAA